MSRVLDDYFRELSSTWGDNWNRFWFLPGDARTLSLMRIFVGCVAIYTQLTYSFDLVRLFGEEGLLPAHVVRHLFDPARLSYFNHTSSATEIWSLHAIGLAVLIVFTAGWYTRITSIAALAVILAYVHRGPLLTGQLEPVLVFLMFYLCLGPSGHWYSVDAWRRKRHTATAPPLTTSATLATRLIQIHVALIYFMMGLSKLTITDSSWWNGSAVFLLLERPESTLWQFEWIRNTKLINFWSHAIVAYELSFPVLVWNRLFRPIVLLGGVLIWLPLAAISPWAPFCLTMLIANLAFVPPGWLPMAAQQEEVSVAAST